MNHFFPSIGPAERKKYLKFGRDRADGRKQRQQQARNQMSNSAMKPISDQSIISAWMAENKALRDALQIIVHSYDARSELYTNDEDLAESLARMARTTLNKLDPSEAPLEGER